MSFIWPPLLLLLLAIPIGVAIYRRREARRAERAAAFGWGSGAVAAAARGGSGQLPARRRGPWLRRLPAILTVAGMTVLVLALARPQSVIGVPRLEGTVLLAFDVSGSMAATDLAPTRMEAAKAAAKAFVERQPSSVRIGVVAFSDSGFAVQPPTNDQSEVQAAIARLGPERATSLGQGILISVQAAELALSGPDTDYYSAPVGASPEERVVT